MSDVQTYQALPTAAPSALEPFRGLTALTQQIFDAAPVPILAMRLDDGSLIYANPLHAWHWDFPKRARSPSGI